jgi:hypothetical protein
MELLRAADSIDLNTLANGGRAPGFHFNVATQLERLPACWLHIGCRKDVPRRACYKARCGNSYVWVEPEGMAGLSAFTLVVLDIATTDPKSLVLPKPAAKVDIQENLRTVEGDKVKEAANKDGPKITEQWYASQEMSADGKNLVYIGRPGTIHGALGNSGKLVIPVITPTAFSQEPAPPTPTQQFFLTTPRASGF